ncbi:MAG: glutaredoxin 3 [Rickettsiales bacterium]|nr:glutaredoxin 3 [Rickettsiales bacterium]|tara:strand:- start:17567 stop:17824 length:258 start_codon:yes stop_codon:yes gene_type:complete
MTKVKIYSKEICPYCVQAKNLLKRKNIIEIEEIDITKSNNKDKMIKESGGRMTVPQIFINDFHVGGFDDLYELDQSNELDKLLKK